MCDVTYERAAQDLRHARLAVVVLALVVVGSGCNSTGATTQTPVSPVSPSPTAQDVCIPTASSPVGPVNDPNGPFFHQMATARTVDGRAMQNARIVLDHASVPDGVRMADGTIRVYYVNGADGGVWVGRLTDASFEPIGPISINGITRPQGMVDPDAYLVSGRVRLAYLAGLGPASSTSPRAMCLADSPNGVSFTVVSTAFRVSAGELLTDPSVTRLSSGAWLMAISAGMRTVLARSNDGLAFSEEARVSFGGVPEVTTLADGRVRLYVCAQGIESYVSNDEGRSWTREGVVLTGTPVLRIVCDPSLVAGTDVFVYKVAP